MMRGRNLLILLAVLVLLGGSAILIDTGRRHQTQPSSKSLFPGLKTEQVDRIKIRTNGQETVLEKKDGSWLVATEGEKPAEPKPVADILDRMTKFFADQVVSTNKANQAVFMVDSTGTEVWVEQKGKQIAHFFVGKSSDDWSSTYVRAADSDRVILVPEYLPSLFQRGESWREKTIFSLDKANFKRYEFVSPSRGALVATKNEADDNWTMETPQPGSIDAAKINRPLQAFSQLKAVGFGDDVTAAAVGIEPDTTKITATLADGSTHVLVVGGPAPANRVYVRKTGSEQIFTIPVGRLKDLLPSISMLLTPAQ